MRTLLFVCTGNTCRSPMAEAIARHTQGDQQRGPEALFVASAGIGAADGQPVTPEAIAALKRAGIEHTGTSKSLSANMIHKADVVLCMTAAQVAAARRLVADSPADSAKIMQLDPQNDIEDPIGNGQAAYDALARQLTRLIPRRLKEVLANANRARI